MGLVLTRALGDTLWVGDDWFKVDAIGSKGFALVDRKGRSFDVSQDGGVEVASNILVEEGFRRNKDTVRIVVNAPQHIPIWRGELKQPAALVQTDETEAALLAPVPYEHLVSGLEVSRKEGKVAFGSRAFEVFRAVETIADHGTLPVFIYASSDAAQMPPRATWRANYVSSVETNNGRHPAGMRFRPPSTEANIGDNLGHWAVFWEVTKLMQVGYKEGIQMDGFYGYRSKKRYLKNFRPEGPVIVENPFLDIKREEGVVDAAARMD